VGTAVYSPNTTLLVSGGADWTVRTWDLQKKPKPVERFVPTSHLSQVYSAAFSPDGLAMVSGSEDKAIRVWDLNAPAPKFASFFKGDNVPVYAVAFSPEGKTVAAGGQHTTVRQWDWVKKSTKPPCVNHPTRVDQISYTPDGKHLVSRSEKLVLVYDAVKGMEVKRFTHETPVITFSVAPDGKRILSGSGTYLYDKDGKIVVKDGKHVYTDCLLRLFDVDSGKPLHELEAGDTPVYATGFSADGKEAYGGIYEPKLRRWKINDGKLDPVKDPLLDNTAGYPHNLVRSPDGKALFLRGSNQSVTQWDAVTGKKVREWTLPEYMGNQSLSSDGRHLAIPLRTGVIYVLRLAPAGG